MFFVGQQFQALKLVDYGIGVGQKAPTFNQNVGHY
jgi:hypothetical protein